MKTKEELMALKAEVEEMKNKLAGLTNEELEQIFGGAANDDDQETLPVAPTSSYRTDSRYHAVDW